MIIEGCVLNLYYLFKFLHQSNILPIYLYEGISEEDRLKWESAKFSEDTSAFKVVDLIFNNEKPNPTGVHRARYGIIAFARSPDLKYVHCILTIYKLDFKLAPTLLSKTHSILWGLYKWSSLDKTEVDRSLTKDEIGRFQNFFRYKALNEFKKEGIIDSISYKTLRTKSKNLY